MDFANTQKTMNSGPMSKEGEGCDSHYPPAPHQVQYARNSPKEPFASYSYPSVQTQPNVFNNASSSHTHSDSMEDDLDFKNVSLSLMPFDNDDDNLQLSFMQNNIIANANATQSDKTIRQQNVKEENATGYFSNEAVINDCQMNLQESEGDGVGDTSPEGSREKMVLSHQFLKKSGKHHLKREKVKNLKEDSEEYQSKSKKSKKVQARSLGDRCTCAVGEYKCNIFTNDERESIFNYVWNLPVDEKEKFVTSLIERDNLSKAATQFYDTYGQRYKIKRPHNLLYFLEVSHSQRMRVCKKFFLSTTGLKKSFIREVLNIKDTKSQTMTLNTQKSSHLSEDRLFCIEEFFNKLPRLPSHYISQSSSSTKSYLEPTFESHADLYQIYLNKCIECERDPLSSILVRQIFDELNLAFYHQCKDQLDLYVGSEHVANKDRFNSQVEHGSGNFSDSEEQVPLNSLKDATHESKLSDSEREKAIDFTIASVAHGWVDIKLEPTDIELAGIVRDYSSDYEDQLAWNPIFRKRTGKDNALREESKKLREQGQEYQSRSKSNLKVHARSLGKRCTCVVGKLKCNKFTDEERERVFDYVWSLSWEDKRRLVTASIRRDEIARRTVEGDSDGQNFKRQNCFTYFLGTSNGQRLRVCKNFFLSTTGLRKSCIRDWVFNIREKRAQTSLVTANRRFCIDFFNELPRLPPSHPARQSSNKFYLESIFESHADLYRIYVSKCIQHDRRPLCRQVVRQIFEELNLALFQPGKDQLDFYDGNECKDELNFKKEQYELYLGNGSNQFKDQFNLSAESGNGPHKEQFDFYVDDTNGQCKEEIDLNVEKQSEPYKDQFNLDLYIGNESGSHKEQFNLKFGSGSDLHTEDFDSSFGDESNSKSNEFDLCVGNSGSFKKIERKHLYRFPDQNNGFAPHKQQNKFHM